MFRRSITDKEISELPRLKFEGKVHLITNDEQVLSAVEELRQNKILGFDTETRPVYKKGKRNKVALLQLATETDAYLFRLHFLTEYKPIFDILSDPDIVKVGVAVNGDFKELKRLYDFEPKNFVELQRYVKDFKIENIGLKKMAAIVLGGRVSKRQQRSDWEANPLSEAQINYAATDAWVSLMIYKKLLKNEKKIKNKSRH